MDRMCAYARNEEIANKLRDKIKTFPRHCMEELKTNDGVFKFEFFCTMLDGIELMGLGASSFGKC